MAKDDPHFRLRVPEALRDRIAEAAKASNRSMNAEIVARLEKSFAPYIPPDELVTQVDRIVEDIIRRAQARERSLIEQEQRTRQEPNT